MKNKNAKFLLAIMTAFLLLALLFLAVCPIHSAFVKRQQTVYLGKSFDKIRKSFILGNAEADLMTDGKILNKTLDDLELSKESIRATHVIEVIADTGFGNENLLLKQEFLLTKKSLVIHVELLETSRRLARFDFYIAFKAIENDITELNMRLSICHQTRVPKTMRMMHFKKVEEKADLVLEEKQRAIICFLSKDSTIFQKIKGLLR